MSLIPQVSQVWLALINTPSVLVRRWPNATAGIKVTTGATPAFSAFTQILAASKISNPEYLTGVFLENPTSAGAAEVWLVDVGVGGAGVEVSVSSGTTTAQGIGSVNQFFASAVGTEFFGGFIKIDNAIRLVGSPRLAAATAGLLVGSKDIFVALQTAFIPNV